MKKREDKKAVVQDYLIWIVIAVVILGILILSVVLFRNKGFSLLDKIADLFRFR